MPLAVAGATERASVNYASVIGLGKQLYGGKRVRYDTQKPRDQQDVREAGIASSGVSLCTMVSRWTMCHVLTAYTRA